MMVSFNHINGTPLSLAQLDELQRAIAIREPLEKLITALAAGRRGDAQVLDLFRAVDKFEGGGSLSETISNIEGDICGDATLQKERDAHARDTEITYLHGQTGARQW